MQRGRKPWRVTHPGKHHLQTHPTLLPPPPCQLPPHLLEFGLPKVHARLEATHVTFTAPHPRRLRPSLASQLLERGLAGVHPPRPVVPPVHQRLPQAPRHRRQPGAAAGRECGRWPGVRVRGCRGECGGWPAGHRCVACVLRRPQYLCSTRHAASKPPLEPAPTPHPLTPIPHPRLLAPTEHLHQLAAARAVARPARRRGDFKHGRRRERVLLEPPHVYAPESGQRDPGGWAPCPARG